MDLPRDVIGIDTETTGLSIPHGDRPFLITAWSFSHNFDDPIGLEERPFVDNHTLDIPGEGAYWDGLVSPFTREVHWDRDELEHFAGEIEHKHVVFFNGGFDLRMLASIGLRIIDSRTGWSCQLPEPYCPELPFSPGDEVVVEVASIEDTQIASHVYDNRGPIELNRLAAYRGIRSDDDKDLLRLTKELRNKAPDDYKLATETDNKGKIKQAPKADYWLVHQRPSAPGDEVNLCLRYGLLDTFRTTILWDWACDEIETDGLEDQYARQMRVYPVFCDMDTEGFVIHKKNFDAQIEKHGSREKEARARVEHTLRNHLPDVKQPNAGSPQQIGRMLYDVLGAPVLKKTETGKPSTDAETIKELGRRDDLSPEIESFLGEIRAFRDEDKVLGMLKSYERRFVRYDGQFYLFGSFNQVGTSLTRCSSSNPNLQQIPKRDPKKTLRDIVRAPRGWRLLAFDYSSVEIRLFARVANEQRMLQLLDEGLDPHRYAAAAALELDPDEVSDEQRSSVGKGVNFGVIYGAGPNKIIRLTGNENVRDAVASMFPRLFPYSEETIRQANRTGQVRTLFGYRLWVAPEPTFKSVNCVVQGSAGDLAKEAMCAVSETVCNEDIRLVGQVHDELLFIVRKNVPLKKTAKRITEAMESVGDQVGVCLPVDGTHHRKSWGKEGSVDL